ncbi:hypothetical protein A616_16455 [Brevibacillus brevis X23]|nr:hypothetical protein A616_16455 [Brevibacillus brevis X23]
MLGTSGVGTLKSAKFNKYSLLKLMGYGIIEDPLLVDCIQKKSHRKTRINKKWGKRYGCYEVPKKDLIQMGNQIIGHPSVIAQLNKLQ